MSFRPTPEEAEDMAPETVKQLFRLDKEWQKLDDSQKRYVASIICHSDAPPDVARCRQCGQYAIKSGRVVYAECRCRPGRQESGA